MLFSWYFSTYAFTKHNYNNILNVCIITKLFWYHIKIPIMAIKEQETLVCCDNTYNNRYQQAKNL